MYNKVDYIEVYYQLSSSMELQGKYCSIERYLRDGYYIKESRNGYWLLVRPSEVLVTAHCGKNGSFVHDMKYGILNHYGRSRITEKLINTFKNDFLSGKIKIEANENDYLII